MFFLGGDISICFTLISFYYRLLRRCSSFPVAFLVPLLLGLVGLLVLLGYVLADDVSTFLVVHSSNYSPSGFSSTSSAIVYSPCSWGPQGLGGGLFSGVSVLRPFLGGEISSLTAVWAVCSEPVLTSLEQFAILLAGEPRVRFSGYSRMK